MTSVAFLALRVLVGGLVAGHGAQKLFGIWGGGGPQGTAAYLASIGIQPARQWALTAGAVEFIGGVLTLLGLLNPIGPIAASSSMVTSLLTQHRGKPIWATQGGGELPITNTAALMAIALAGPGVLSLDRVFGARVPWWFSFLVLAGAGMGIAVATEPEAIPLPSRTQTAAPAEQRERQRVPANGEAEREEVTP